MGISDLLFPKNCLECRSSGKYICASCLKKVPRAKETCPACDLYSFRGKTHKSCLRPLGLDGASSIWAYKGVIRKAILGLKYRFANEIAQELTLKAVENCKLKNENCILVPVPLHKRRQNWRGFNQSAEIGKQIAKTMDWQFMLDLLIRKKFTTPQVELRGEKRRSNVLGAFSLNPEYSIQDAVYIIFDDVWTTGSTIKEACKVLKRNGAKKVWGLTLAR